jgi:hypothetical protein
MIDENEKGSKAVDELRARNSKATEAEIESPYNEGCEKARRHNSKAKAKEKKSKSKSSTNSVKVANTEVKVQEKENENETESIISLNVSDLGNELFFIVCHTKNN